ncbi:hypothetical protein BVX95_01825 [archaeon D22]|nr:hypothetical protein BVX95_01825 [archaeon D22]
MEHTIAEHDSTADWKLTLSTASDIKPPDLRANGVRAIHDMLQQKPNKVKGFIGGDWFFPDDMLGCYAGIADSYPEYQVQIHDSDRFTITRRRPVLQRQNLKGFLEREFEVGEDVAEFLAENLVDNSNIRFSPVLSKNKVLFYNLEGRGVRLKINPNLHASRVGAAVPYILRHQEYGPKEFASFIARGFDPLPKEHSGRNYYVEEDVSHRNGNQKVGPIYWAKKLAILGYLGKQILDDHVDLPEVRRFASYDFKDQISPLNYELGDLVSVPDDVPFRFEEKLLISNDAKTDNFLPNGYMVDLDDLCLGNPGITLAQLCMGLGQDQVHLVANAYLDQLSVLNGKEYNFSDVLDLVHDINFPGTFHALRKEMGGLAAKVIDGKPVQHLLKKYESHLRKLFDYHSTQSP